MTSNTADAGLSAEKRYALLRSVGEECIQECDLQKLVEKKPNIRCYDGFEPSGRMHIAQGVFKAINVNKCTDAGCEFVFWVADWFALMNDKVGGELEKIRVVGEYLIEVWKAAGMNMDNVRFLWSSEEITAHTETYWKVVLDIGRRNTIARIKKCCTIMGKQEGTLTAAQVLYPLMQCGDIFFLKADICQLGLDQRKVNMLAREYCDLTGRKLKPVILSHHMLAGLKQGQAKMSKSDPDSAIFMEDSAEDVVRKIKQAYCPRSALSKPSGVDEDDAPIAADDKNPVLDYLQCIVYSTPTGTMRIGDVSYDTYDALESAFLNGSIDESSLKDALAAELNVRLDPVRRHFATDARAGELLAKVKSYRQAKGDSPVPTVPTESTESTVAQPSAPSVAVAWLPAATRLSLDAAIAMGRAMREFLRENPDGTALLLLPDWSAFACGAITGEEKAIHAALELNLALLQASGSLPDGVRVVRQSELILNHRSDYWVAAINAGRRTTLRFVEEACGELRNAGQVVVAVMYAADIAMLKATHVISTSADACFTRIASACFDGCLTTVSATAETIPPLHRPDAEPAAMSADDVLYLDDTDMDVRRKIKKAYCAPNEGENPVIAVALWILSERAALLIERAEANGGNKSYESAEELHADAASGALHPADLKAAVTKALVERCAFAKTVLSSADGKKHSQVLRQAEKTLLKKGNAP